MQAIRFRWICGGLAALGLVLLVGLAGTARAGTDLTSDQVKVILHTATPEEDGFIDRTLAMVEKGTLPVDLFESCLLWARRKPRHQFQFFKQALVLRAADQGITVQ
ncbi:MAG: hypothetical protein ABSG86_25065 [Thermoguttaceae bacterium]|jgi:hypothetical protein